MDVIVAVLVGAAIFVLVGLLRHRGLFSERNRRPEEPGSGRPRGTSGT